MKKLVTLMLTLCVALLPALSLAEETTEMDTVLEGFVTEILEEGFVMDDAEMGEIQLNTSDATVWDGVLAEQDLAIGQYVIVDYDGRTTFSLPPQAHADRVGCYVLEGVIGEMLEDGFMLTGDLTFGDVIVHTEEALDEMYLNVPVTVYYDGAMTLSLPGQVGARHIVIPSLNGMVSELTEEGFTLTDDDGQIYQVLFGENTLIGELLPETEEEIIMDDPAEIADEEDAEEALADEEEIPAEPDDEEDAEEAPADEEEIPAEPADEEPAVEEADEESSPIELTDGDYVTVFFNGAMTRSIPPQLTAIEVLIHR